MKVCEDWIQDISYKKWLEEIRRNGRNLRRVPAEFKTAELCLATVKHNGIALEHVPEKYKTRELCLIAIRQRGKALQFLPDEFVTKDGLLESEFVITAVKSDWRILENIPYEYRTYEVCKAAMNGSFWARALVPKEFKELEKLLSRQKIIEKFGIETLLTSDKYYLRELGLSEKKYLKINEGFSLVTLFS